LPDKGDDISPSGDNEPKESLEEQIYNYLSETFDKAYGPYYEGLEYEISGYEEKITENEFCSTFLFTMRHLDSGGDIASEKGKETQANFNLMAEGTYVEGISGIESVMMDVSPVGEPNYSVPVEECFPDENATLSLVGYIKDIDVTGGKILFDKVFFLTTPENDDLLNELGVTSENMSDGYYLYNPDERAFEYEVADDAEFYRNEIMSGRPWTLVETELSMIKDTLHKTTRLYRVVVKNSAAVLISEFYTP
jgi:hypothetical protein